MMLLGREEAEPRTQSRRRVGERSDRSGLREGLGN